MEDSYREIPLGGKLGAGKAAKVDADVYEWARHFPWALHERYPVIRCNGTTLYLHRVVVGCPEGMHVHHRNGDKIDARRENLEVLSPDDHLWQMANDTATAAFVEKSLRVRRGESEITAGPLERELA